MTAELESRLRQLEERLRTLEQRLSAAQEAEIRRRRAGTYVRIGLFLVIAAFYYLYLRSITNLS